MTETKELRPPRAGASYENKPAWLAQRQGGCTATEVRELAKGSSAYRRELIADKISGKYVNLDGNKYIDRGNVREPIIAQYLYDNFEIEPCDLVYSAGDNDRHLASPDGLSATFELDGITSEIKTSKHDLTPGEIVGGVLTATQPSQFAKHFASSGYYDQMQWQMRVMGGERVLFTWEQHDDNWPDPKPLHDRPLWCWVPRNQARIDRLVEIADAFLADLDAAKVGTIAPVSADPVDPEVADHVHKLLKYRDDEAVAAKLKGVEWAWPQQHLVPTGSLEDDKKLDLAEASVLVSTKTSDPSFTDIVDMEGMRKQAPRLVAQYESLLARFTVRTTVPGSSTTKLTVTKKKEIEQ